jgi:hypothetical protein
MPDPITITIREITGEPMMCASDMALLFGVTLADVHALPFADGVSLIPREWIQRGRRRTREAAAHTGSDDLLDVLTYWARADHGADLVVVYR